MQLVVLYLLAGQTLDSALQHPLKHFTDNAANLGLTWVGKQENKKNDNLIPRPFDCFEQAWERGEINECTSHFNVSVSYEMLTLTDSNGTTFVALTNLSSSSSLSGPQEGVVEVVVGTPSDPESGEIVWENLGDWWRHPLDSVNG